MADKNKKTPMKNSTKIIIGVSAGAAIVAAVAITLVFVLQKKTTSSSSATTSSSSFSQSLPEAYLYYPTSKFTSSSQASTACQNMFGASLATNAQLTAAKNAGAQWCAAGWTSDDGIEYPMQSTVTGCGNAGINNNGTTGTAGATCYGVKPPEGTVNIREFSTVTNQWSEYSTV
jgi:hypothetical protein